MTILVAVADSLGFKGSIMAIYLGETKKSVLSFPSLLELKRNFKGALMDGLQNLN